MSLFVSKAGKILKISKNILELEREPAIPEGCLSILSFRNLFTTAEKVALYTKSQTDIVLKIFIDDLSVTEWVDFKNFLTIQGMQYLVQQEIITVERYNEIMPEPFSVEN